MKSSVCRRVVMRSAAAVLVTLTGCTAASYGLGVATMANDMKVRQREDYDSYRRRAESQGAPRIMTFREWVRSNG